MPLIKEISKCRRVSRNDQILEDNDSIDEGNSEVEENYVEYLSYCKGLSGKGSSIKSKSNKSGGKTQMDGGARKFGTDGSSKKQALKISYPKPLPKIPREKVNSEGILSKTPGTKPNLTKSSTLQEKKSERKPPISKKPLAKNSVKESLSNPTGGPSNPHPKRQAKVTKEESKKGYKKDEEAEEEFKMSSEGTEETKQQIEARIRKALVESRLDAEGGADLTDVSLGSTESTPSDGSVDIGAEPAMSSTPEGLSEEEEEEIWSNWERLRDSRVYL